ncbi:MAG TPA: cation-translocating P-type ATPase, partial [Desulfovibrio sp.]|nr:cation-translocating P-type ATPase [Desulfovibrio sp.]
ALEALKNMLSPSITALRDGVEKEVPSTDLVPGDILLLEAGDKVPADARVLESHSLRCDEAALTGESAPVGKNPAALPEAARLADRRNMAFTGTSVTYGRGRALVVETGMHTAFGAIAREVAAVATEKTPLEKRTEEIGKWLGLLALGICGLVAGVSILRQALDGKIDLQFIVTVVMFAISLAVAAVPEALAAIVTGALAIGMRQMARKNALVRKMPAVETLGCTTVICSDKTGTLTRGEMTVRRIVTADGPVEIGGAGYAPEGALSGAADSEALRRLLLAGLLCNDADLEERDGAWRIQGDPTEAALVVAAVKAGLPRARTRLENPRLEELPFSSERKRMTTLHALEDGRRMAFMKGAPETVLERCAGVLQNGRTVPLDDALRAEILTANAAMAQDALRVLGLACRQVAGDACSEEETERDMVFLGLAGMMDPPRPEAVAAVAVCRRVGITPVMITGDHRLTAVAVARETGIFREGDRVLDGEDLERMDDRELAAVVRQITVYARVSPLDKLKIVKAWKSLGEVVAMTGDGVNDAPALKHADIGVAMGLSGTEVAKEAADMVLADDNFASIVTAIELGRWIYDNIKKYLTYLLRCNITEVAVIGGAVLVLGPEYLPLLPAAILYINLATDGLPALALGVAPPDPDIMERPPRDPQESVFSWDVKAFVALAIGIEIPFFLFLFFHDLFDIAHARTEMFFLFTIVELVIALNFRSMRYSIFAAPPHKWLLAAIAWEVLLVVGLIQFEVVREAFGILLPRLSDLTMIFVFSGVVFLSMEGIKVLIRRRLAARSG